FIPRNRRGDESLYKEGDSPLCLYLKFSFVQPSLHFSYHHTAWTADNAVYYRTQIALQFSHRLRTQITVHFCARLLLQRTYHRTPATSKMHCATIQRLCDMIFQLSANNTVGRRTKRFLQSMCGFLAPFSVHRNINPAFRFRRGGLRYYF